MNGKSKNLYLILAIVCFIGIIAIFIFDGYLGVYENIEADNGQYVQTVSPDEWGDDDFRYLAGFSVEEGQVLDFTYQVDNRRFSAFEEDVRVSIKDSQGTFTDLVDTRMSVGAFSSGEITWTFNPAGFVPESTDQDRQIIATLVLKAGAREHSMTLYINLNPYVEKIPVPEAE